MVVFLESSALSTGRCWSSVRMSLVTSLTQALLLYSHRLAGQPTLGRVLVVPNVLHLKMMEATVVIGTFGVTNIFL